MPTFTLTIFRTGNLSGSDTGSTSFDDPSAHYYVVITLTNVSPAYYDGTAIRPGQDIVVFVNSSVDFTNTYDYEPTLFWHQLSSFSPGHLVPNANADGYVYDPGTGSYVTVSIPEPHLLADSYSELRDAAGLRDSVHRIDLLPNSELGARSVFTFGRYGPAGDLFEAIQIDRYPDASATLRLPLPLNIHNTQGAPLIATHASTVAMPFEIPDVVHPINDQTFGFMQVYLDTPGQVRDDAYVDLSLPAASNTDIIVQVPVPVLTVGGEILPGGSVINLRDGRILRAKRFQNTSPILITLVGDAVGNIVGGGGGRAAADCRASQDSAGAGVP